MTTEMFKRWRANEFYQCPTIEDVLTSSIMRPHKNYTIKSGNTWYAAGVLVVNKKPRLFTIQVDNEVYPIVVNSGGKSTKFVSRNHISEMGEAAKAYGWGKVMHPWLVGDTSDEVAQYYDLKKFVFIPARRGEEPVVEFLVAYTGNGAKTLGRSNHARFVKLLERDAKFRPAFDVLADRLEAFCNKVERTGMELHGLVSITNQFQTAKAGAANRTDAIAEMRTNGRRAA